MSYSVRRTLHRSRLVGTARRLVGTALRSETGSLFLYTLLLLYCNWLYKGVKRQAQTTALARGPAAARVPDAAAGAGEDGILFSCGLDANYRLGRTGGDDAATAQPTLAQLHVSAAAASRHSLVLLADGAGVWSMGANDSRGGGGHGSAPLAAAGQLGRNGSQAPGPVALVGQQRLVAVAAGRYHSVAVTASGAVLTWGLNDWGQLGRAVPAAPGSSNGSASATSCSSGAACAAAEPGVVDALQDVTAVAAAAGRYSTLVLDDAGRLWVWGFDGCASGVLPAQDTAWRPRVVQGALEGKQVVAFDAGYTFWLAATDVGELYTCDTQDDGYSGTLPEKRKPNNAGQLGRTGPPHEPGRVAGALASKTVTAVAAGRQHALVATSDGQVFSFGGGRAVLGREGPAHEPARVGGVLEEQSIRHVAAGEYSAFAASDSLVWGWGSRAYSCTGAGAAADAGSADEVLQPTLWPGLLGSGQWTIHSLAAGYQHTLVVASNRGSPEAARLRQEAAAAVAAAAASGSPQHGVEVVLTDAQQAAQQQQRQAEAATAAAAAASTPDEAAGGEAGDAAGDAAAEQPEQQQQQAEAATAAAAAGTPDEAAGGDGDAAAEQPEQQQQQQPEHEGAGPGADLNQIGVAANTPSTAGSGDASAKGGAAADHTSYLALQPPPLAASVQEIWAAATPAPYHEQLVALAPDVFAGLPASYNTQHRNPCWGEGPDLKCLPAFHIIGVSKCGTTDLYHRLTLAKGAIYAATNKGPHFFDECPHPPAVPSACQAGPTGDFSAYVNLFSRAADLIRSHPAAITGEASSNTFTSANGVFLRGFRGGQPAPPGTNATMPALLREAFPYLRLILLLRDPVDRYHSAYYYYRWWIKDATPPTPQQFHDHALAELQAWRACVAERSVAECVRRFKQQQLIKGMYAEFLQDWLRHWPRQQLLILRTEDYIAATREHLQAVLAFLGVAQDDLEAGVLDAMVASPVQNKREREAMLPATHAALDEFYAPFNAQLAAALADDSWLWRDGAA